MTDKPKEPKVLADFVDYKRKIESQKAHRELEKVYPQRQLEYTLEDGSRLIIIKSPTNDVCKELNELRKYRHTMTSKIVSGEISTSDPKISQVIDADINEFIESVMYSYNFKHVPFDLLTDIGTTIKTQIFTMLNSEFQGISKEVSTNEED